MSIEIGYFDEAGGKDIGFTFVCGWISSVERWEKFEFDWRLLLSSHNLPYFHMKEFAHSSGPFEKWRNAEGSRRKFLMQAADIIHSVAQRAFICGVHHDLKGQCKTGHAWSLQNRPYGMAQDVILIYPAFS